MSRTLVPVRPVPALDRWLRWLLAVGRELLPAPGFVAKAVTPRQTTAAIDVTFHPHWARPANAPWDSRRLDAATGCEFVDDLIRHAE